MTGVPKGFLFIDKPNGMSSFEVVRKIRAIVKEKRVGHSGTLDPMATGLLIVAIGEATKILEYLIGSDKDYEVLAKFGEVSDTYDREGKITRGDFALLLDRKVIEFAIQANFLGLISQIPPKYSALKINGKRAYELARAGVELKMKAREVEISKFEIIDFSWPNVSFRVSCGSGTYIRSLIHDLGQQLKCGAFVGELRRTRIGKFFIKDAVELDPLSKNIDQYLIPIESVVEKFNSIILSDDDFVALQDGRVLKNKKIEQDVLGLAFYQGKVVGILENSTDGSGIKFRKRIF